MPTVPKKETKPRTIPMADIIKALNLVVGSGSVRTMLHAILVEDICSDPRNEPDILQMTVCNGHSALRVKMPIERWIDLAVYLRTDSFVQAGYIVTNTHSRKALGVEGEWVPGIDRIPFPARQINDFLCWKGSNDWINMPIFSLHELARYGKVVKLLTPMEPIHGLMFVPDEWWSPSDKAVKKYRAHGLDVEYLMMPMQVENR